MAATWASPDVICPWVGVVVGLGALVAAEPAAPARSEPASVPVAVVRSSPEHKQATIVATVLWVLRREVTVVTRERYRPRLR